MDPDRSYILVPSSNRGRYACDDPDTGHDLTSGDMIAVEVLTGVWVEGHVEHSQEYSGAGCYHIADAGQHHPTKRSREVAPEELLQATLSELHDLFRGYYLVTKDGQILGLCTGVKVRLL